MQTVLAKNPPRRRVRSLTATAAAGLVMWTATAAAALPADGYADLVEEVSPAVVFISTTQKAAPRTSRGLPDGHMMPFPPDSPLGEMFRHFFDRMPQQKRRPTAALGSGFIIDASGDIVTNNHVIDGADAIKVKLPDGREYDAELVGSDPQTDLALLRVEADEPLPFVGFDDSDTLRAGDVVLAVGNPFGLGGTVTAGIVSARNRNINSGPYDDFIQTDAAINRGNSGGPLFDTKGGVVGVNTAIFSPNGGSVGIGFAIPSNIASDVIAQLKDKGSVERGWLGVQIQAVTPELASALGLDEPRGALVVEPTEDGPAIAAGLRQGDVIVGYNGKAITRLRDLPRAVAATAPGMNTDVTVWRDGEEQIIEVEIGRLDRSQLAAANDNDDALSSDRLGAELAMLDDRARSRLDLDEGVSGVLIVAVDDDGPAARQGLRPGDVIMQVGRTRVDRPQQVADVLAGLEEKSVLLLINRQGRERFVGFKVAGV